MTDDLEARLATINDAEKLYYWANDTDTRRNSFNPDYIKWEDHTKWFKTKLNDLNTRILIFSFKDKLIGTVRIEESSFTIISITVAPEHRGKGLGHEMIKKACKLYWVNSDNDIIAYVKNDNISSRRVFEKSGFIFFNVTEINNISCLTLKACKNGNR